MSKYKYTYKQKYIYIYTLVCIYIYIYVSGLVPGAKLVRGLRQRALRLRARPLFRHLDNKLLSYIYIYMCIYVYI